MRVATLLLVALASTPVLAEDGEGGAFTWSDAVYGIALFVAVLAVLAFIGSRR